MRRFLFLGALSIVASGALLGCDSDGVADRFVFEAGPDVGDGGDALGDAVFPDADPTLGGPCVDDTQCQNAKVTCATFHCDTSIGRCRGVPDDTRCDDGVYCDGAERCDVRLGCQPGPAIDCSGTDECLIGACQEATRTCKQTPRDADGDGDPTAECGSYGHDCNDRDPTVSSKAAEICGNGVDDNCNGMIDEMPCVSPTSSTCDTAITITGAGTYPLALAATKRTIGASCADAATFVRQNVVAVKVPAGAPQDVDLLVSSTTGARVALAAGTTCGVASTELGCNAAPPSTTAARLRLRALAPGVYPVYVFANAEISAELKVSFGAPTTPANNLTCATAASLFSAGAASVSETVQVIDVGATPSACTEAAGPLLYRFTVPADGPRDLTVHATPADASVQAVLGLRDASCVAASSELTCGTAGPATLFARALRPGTYYLDVGATTPNDVVLDAALTPATRPIAGDECGGAPALPLGTTVEVDTTRYQADIAATCLGSTSAPSLAADLAYDLSLAEASDVLIVAHGAGSDTLGLGMAGPACATMDLGCGQGYPLRMQRRALPAGDYRVIAESQTRSSISLSSFVRPAATPGPDGADGCGGAPVVIPPTGGLFVGDTSKHHATLDETCDASGEPKFGAPESIYRIDLAARTRLLVDAWGSAFTTTLSIRQGASCPGVEIMNGCGAGYYPGNAFLDVVVDPGTYWIVVDGYALQSGAFRLDVRTATPSP
jgi:hypothetical protein